MSAEIEYQWGVRTVYTDGSSGIDWSNQGDAESFLVHYADYDGASHMRVTSRELIRRTISPGAIEPVDSSYAERRQRADRARNRNNEEGPN